MAPRFPVPHVVPPTASHAYTLILLHGRGGEGKEFADELFEAESSQNLTLPDLFPNVKWVFPTAPDRYSTMFEEDMRDWFELSSLTDPEDGQNLQVPGLSDGIVSLLELIEEEVQDRGGYASKVALGGMSQGCAMAIHALLAGRHQLGSFVGFCGWLPFRGQLGKIAAEKAGEGAREVKMALNDFYFSTLGLMAGSASSILTSVDTARLESSVLNTPVLLCHCADDGIVDVQLGRRLCGTLEALGMDVTWHEHAEGGHWINEPEGVDSGVAFLSSRFHDMT